jgi:hypothetical protein
VEEKKGWVIIKILDERLYASTKRGRIDYQRQYWVARRNPFNNKKQGEHGAYVNSEGHNNSDPKKMVNGVQTYWEYMPSSVVDKWRAGHPLKEVPWVYTGHVSRRNREEGEKLWGINVAQLCEE